MRLHFATKQCCTLNEIYARAANGRVIIRRISLKLKRFRKAFPIYIIKYNQIKRGLGNNEENVKLHC